MFLIVVILFAIAVLGAAATAYGADSRPDFAAS